MPWQPRFSECDHIIDGGCSPSRYGEANQAQPRTYVGEDGATYMTGRTEAATGLDGKIGIFLTAFFTDKGKPNPENVAAAIAHETVHWVLDAKRDGKKRPGPTPSEYYGSERAAYDLQIEFLKSIGRPTSKLERTANQYRRQESLSNGLGWDQIPTQHPHWLDTSIPRVARTTGEQPASLESVKDGSEVEFSRSWREEARSLIARERERRERELERQVSEIWAAGTRPQPAALQPSINTLPQAQIAQTAEAINPDPAAVISIGFNDMRSIVTSICRDPGSLTSGQLKEFGWRWRTWQAIIDQNESLKTMNVYEGLGGCPLALMTAMLTRSPSGTPGSAADRDWVVQTVYAYNAAQYNPPPTRRSTNDPESHDINGEGKARDQAKGIKAGSRGWDKP